MKLVRDAVRAKSMEGTMGWHGQCRLAAVGESDRGCQELEHRRYGVPGILHPIISSTNSQIHCQITVLYST